jgi:hypothetical protein
MITWRFVCLLLPGLIAKAQAAGGFNSWDEFIAKNPYITSAECGSSQNPAKC